MTNGSHSPPPLLEEGDDEGARRRSSFMPSPRALLQALKLTQGSISPKAMQTMTVFASMNQDNHDPVTTPAPLKSEHPIYRAPTRHDTNISFNSDGMSSQGLSSPGYQDGGSILTPAETSPEGATLTKANRVASRPRLGKANPAPALQLESL
ncbi:hypothetical protein DIPPA_25220 [Diplonema papillatum]|nr:hypothetical protein DIPPA_25220 [Diplonema papillatum]